MAGRPKRGKDGALRAALLLLALLAAPGRAAAQLPPPDDNWGTLETERFRVTYPARLDPLARRAAAIAERAWDELAGALPRAPGPRVDLVLTDHVDFSNGYASVAPRKRIVVFARPPVDGFELGYFDDWMEFVITHELAHVFHLDYTSRFGRVLRGLFGRVPSSWPLFPELDTPRWLTEGLAVWYETALTESGRGQGTYHDMVLRTAALEDRVESIDRASGESAEWPGGARAYVYGSSFFEWLLARHGPERMGALVEAIGGLWIPYRLNAAATKAFGASFSSEWRAWTIELTARSLNLRDELAERAPLTRPERITFGGRYVQSPAVSPQGDRLAYARSDGRTDAHIRVSEPSGEGPRPLARVNGLPYVSWAPDGTLIAAQLEFSDPYRLTGDLYRFDTAGVSTRITRGERLDHPAVERDGRTALAIRNVSGTTELVRVDLESGSVAALQPADPDVHWAFPAPSPDGRWIAAARWRRGRSFDLVVLDRDGALVGEVGSDRAIEQSPAWSPDSQWLVWSSDRSGIPNLYGVAVGSSGQPTPMRQVTNVLTGIAQPSVDPSGRWIYAVVYHANGWGVERVAFDPTRWFDPFPLAPVYQDAVPETPPEPVTAEAHGYRAIETLGPKFWSPVFLPNEEVFIPGRGDVEMIGPFIGAFTAGSDVVGRHAWQLSAAVSTTDNLFEGSFGWVWAGLGNPLISLFADQDWDGYGPLTGRRSTGGVDTLFVRERERRLSLGSTWVLRRYRTSGALSLSAALVSEDSELLDRDLEPTSAFSLSAPSSRLGDLRGSLSLSTARAHALAISTEEGIAVSLAGRIRSHLALADTLSGVAGSDRSFTEGIARARAYQSLRALGLERHVIAGRATGGIARGVGADRFHFEAGGDPLHSFFVRGYENGERAGRYAWSASAEYRFPLARVNRGRGLLPIHLDQLSGALFADWGNAWGPDFGSGLPRYDNPRRDPLAAVGAELAADLLGFFTASFPLRGGFAVPLQGTASTERYTPVWYLRLGPSF